MIHRLDSLHLLPPPTAGIWSGNQIYPIGESVTRRDAVDVRIDAPLFWYEPPWIRLQPDIADQLAIAVSKLDVTVSALSSDLAMPDGEIDFLAPQLTDDGNEYYLPRMLPYRIERYGLTAEDFDHAKIVDVRVSASRDESGRLAYAPQQMKRWEQPPEDAPIAGGGYVAAGNFPPDVVSLKQLAVKLDQIRLLSPSAAVFVSIGPFRMEEEIGAAMVSKPDGVIIRLDEIDLPGKFLASLVVRARKHMDKAGGKEIPLWLVPGHVSPDDVVKLIALGASAVAIDSWCEPMMESAVEMAPSSRYRSLTKVDLTGLASEHLWDDIDRVFGLLSSLPKGLKAEQYLGSFNSSWAQACGVAALK